MAAYQITPKGLVTPATEKASATDFFASDLTVAVTQSLIRVSVALGSAGTFGYVLTSGAASTTPILLNGGSDLTANSEYAFEIPLRRSDTINFQHQIGASTSILKCQVDEIFEGGVF